MIIVKTQDEIARISRSCRIVAEVIKGLETFVKSGMTTKDIENYCERKIRQRGGVPAFKGYRGFPANVCISLNNQVIHGIPSRSVIISEGDMVSIDIGVYCNGFYGDGATTIAIGRIPDAAQKLLETTREALFVGISKATEGNRVSDISFAIQEFVERHDYSVVRAFVGHGIGRSLHEDPQVPNYGTSGKGARLKRGMTLAIEPMVNAGEPGVIILDDGWTAVTADGSLSAHFEHTVAITGNGPKILTNLD